jgi:PAS domain S-box-containing protein
METKPTYKELEQRVKELKTEVAVREKIEKSLPKREKWLLGLIEAIPDFVYIKDRKGRYLFVNKAFEKIVNKNKEDIIGKSDNQLLPPELSEQAVGSDKEILEKLEPIRNEQHLTDIKGETFFFDTIKFPIFDKQNNVKELGGVSRNITDHKKAEEALLESEIRFRNLVEAMSEGLGVADENSLVTYINDRLSEMIGYSPDETIGRPIYDFIDETNHELVKETIEERKRGESGSFELVLKRKDNQKVHTIMSSRPIFDAEGQFRGSFGVMTDITERKKTEKALRESEEKYRLLFSTVSDAVMVIDAETREFLDVNKAASSIYGYSKEEFLELKQIDITSEPEKSNGSINKTISGEISSIPLRYHIHKDGTIFPVEITPGVFYLGNRKMVFGVARDITERMQAEKALRESENRYRAVVESQTEMICRFLPDGTLTFVNDAYRTVIGVDTADRLMRSFLFPVTLSILVLLGCRPRFLDFGFRCS